MTTALETTSTLHCQDIECVTFYLGDLLLGVDINQVQEIIRHHDVTVALGTPEWVRGVNNLRGDVLTLVDLHILLDLEAAEESRHTCNIIVHSAGETIGLLVDRVADVIQCAADKLELPPANMNGVEGRFIRNVCQLDTGLLGILDTDQLLNTNHEER